MDKKTIILTSVIFILIIIGMFTFAHLKKSELNEVSSETNNPELEEIIPYPEITRIDAKHYFIDGVHTFAGELLLPTPCDLLNTEAFVMKSLPEQIKLDFTVINNSENCIQTITAQRFLVSATASEQATVTADFMGRAVELNLIPAAEGDRPEDFEVFIKG